MPNYNITEGSIKTLGENKTCMEVTFTADDGREVTQYHEVESVDPKVIEESLSQTALEFESRSAEKVESPILETGKDIEATVAEESII